MPAAITGCGLLLAGVSVGWSVVAGAAVLVTGILAIASVIAGRPVVADLFIGDHDPAVLEAERWDEEVKAANAARRRNLESRGGSYWIEVEVEPGVWGIERRRYRAGRSEGDSGNGGDGWYGGGGGGGGGNGGG